jgi:hypothetical protein
MSEAPQGTAAETAVEQADPSGRLFGPDPLTTEEASRLLAQGPSGRLVVWMGEPDSGKTTLTTQLYERQRRGGEHTRFAGSQTLLAFERLAYPRRGAAGRATVPPRRSVIDPEGREILHLALSAGESRVHLLLAELPSEIFRQLADNQLSTAGIPLLRRADKLALLIDGGRLCDHDVRASVLTRARQLLERLHADAEPHRGTELALVVTKWDCVDADASAMAYWQPREEELLAELRLLDPSAPHLRVAAGAAAGYPADDGFATLRSWLLAPTRAAAEPPIAPYDWPADAPARLRRPRRRRGA